MHVSFSLREARERARLTQTELARRSGTSQTALSAYESGAKTPSVSTLARILAACGSRLTIEPDHQPLIIPSARQHERTARALDDVLALAAALPTRHDRALRFPPLGRKCS